PGTFGPSPGATGPVPLPGFSVVPVPVVPGPTPLGPAVVSGLTPEGATPVPAVSAGIPGLPPVVSAPEQPTWTICPSRMIIGQPMEDRFGSLDVIDHPPDSRVFHAC